MHLSLRNDLKANLKEWKLDKQTLEERQGKTGKIVLFRRRVFAYAAAACVVLLAGIFVTLWILQPEANALADEYFTENSPSLRNSRTGIPASVAGVIEKIQQEDYAAAMSDLQTLLADSTGQENLLFLKGECHYRLEQYSLAASAFEQVIGSTSSTLNRQKAEWYLLLTYLKVGKNKPEFQNLLRSILADQSHVFYPEAEQLKSRL